MHYYQFARNDITCRTPFDFVDQDGSWRRFDGDEPACALRKKTVGIKFEWCDKDVDATLNARARKVWLSNLSPRIRHSYGPDGVWFMRSNA